MRRNQDRMVVSRNLVSSMSDCNSSCRLQSADLAPSFDHSAEVMNPYFQNQTCSPYTDSSDPCTLGNYASYSINVTGATDVIAGIAFAKKNNIRLVIKNTGHE